MKAVAFGDRQGKSGGRAGVAQDRIQQGVVFCRGPVSVAVLRIQTPSAAGPAQGRPRAVVRSTSNCCGWREAAALEGQSALS